MTSEKPMPGAMPGLVPEGAPQPADFTPVSLAKTLLRSIRAGALGTLDRNTGHPVTTLTNVATDVDGAPIILVSGLSSHTANLNADPRASLLLAETGKGDPLAHPRLTVLGAMRRVPNDDPLYGRVRARFLSRHPKSALYVDFPDFTFQRMNVASAHLNGGFARAADLAGADILTDLVDAEALIASEAEAIEHMNADHAEAVRLYATALAGARAGAWTLTGIDPEGLDLLLGTQTARVTFARRVSSPGVLQKVLKEMAMTARSTAERATDSTKD